ncbi:MAG: pilus assembly protein PilM [Gammaproteobacteria bacterium]
MSALLEKLKSGLAPKQKISGVGPIGLHLAEEQAHAVQLRRLASGSLCLRAWASAPYADTREETLADPEALQELKTALLGRGMFKGHRIVTALPPAMTRIASLNYQAAGPTPDSERILRLMAERLDGPLDDYVIDYMPVRGNEKAREKVALVTTSRRADVLEFLDRMRRAGLEVAELEVGPAAINRVVSALPHEAENQGNVLVINYGADHTYLTLISGRRLLMDKEIEFGANPLIQQIARGLDISTKMAEDIALREGFRQTRKPMGATGTITADDLNPVVEIVRPVFSRLAEEVRRACLYVASESKGDAVEAVYAFGTVARWPGADRMLSEVAHVPVADTLPLAAIFDTATGKGMENYPGIGPDLAIATGLALRGLTDGA